MFFGNIFIETYNYHNSFSNLVLFGFSTFQLLFKLFSHYKLLRFASDSQRQLSHKFYVFRNFVMSNMAFAKMQYLMSAYFIMMQVFYLN